MNLIQIANGMGDRITFGDLPQSTYIIEKINALLPEEVSITVTTTGNEFIAIFEKLKNSQQNQLATVIESDVALRLEIVSDIAFHEISERRRERQVFQNNFKIYIAIILVVVMANIYNAYTYHQVATKLLGDQYESSVLGVLKDAFNFYDNFTKSSENQVETADPQ